jgi:hypothetical protein
MTFDKGATSSTKVWNIYIYRVFNHRGNGLLNEPRVARFSATALPFPAGGEAGYSRFV